MADILYDLLKEDNKECFDVAISKPTRTSVKFWDQAGAIIIDFEERTIETIGDLEDCFSIKNKEDIDEYITESTYKIMFFEFKGRTHASLIDLFNSLEELRNKLEDHSIFMYLDLDKVFK